MQMTFTQQLVITLVDKLIIAGALVIVGYWLNKRLEAFKTDQAKQLQILRGQQDELLEIRKEHHEMALEMHREQQNLAKELRDLQTQKELQITAQIASARLPAYRKLWEIQDVTAESLGLELSPEQRKELENKLRATYFRNGNAIFLSHSAVTRYRTAMKCLKETNSTSQDIRDAFTAFRTQLKSDVKVYNEEEAKKPTKPEPRDKGADAESRP